jgi:hypothetical protein
VARIDDSKIAYRELFHPTDWEEDAKLTLFFLREVG